MMYVWKLTEAATDVQFPDGYNWTIAFRDIARATDARTIIAAITPKPLMATSSRFYCLQTRKLTVTPPLL